MREAFIEKRFNRKSRVVIQQVNDIIAEYLSEGYKLTLRQLYYQFVARDLIPNSQKAYKRLGSLVSDARLAGEVDWDAIEDRTRGREQVNQWSDVQSILSGVAEQFRLKRWEGQHYHVEAWIEKQALIGVLERVCRELYIPWFACKGYVSQSEQYDAGVRFRRLQDEGKQPVILHLGDHDPSGMDMTRDNENRLTMFARMGVTVERLALNFDQVEQYGPPPNPAKVTDSRYARYVQEYGNESWELDALEPQVLSGLVRERTLAYRDEEAWNAVETCEDAERYRLDVLQDSWDYLEPLLDSYPSVIRDVARIAELDDDDIERVVEFAGGFA